MKPDTRRHLEQHRGPNGPQNTTAPAAIPYVATAEEAALNLRRLRNLGGDPDTPSGASTHFSIAHEFPIPTRSPK